MKKHPRGYWTKERVFEAARQCNTRAELVTLYRGADNAVWKNGWSSELDEILPRSTRPSGYWSKEKIIETAYNCKTRAEFIGKYDVAYHAAQKNGWLDDLNAVLPPSKTPIGYWTKDRVFDVANRCETWKEFQKTYDGAYKAAKKNGWLGEVKTILPCGRVKYYWTKEHIFEAAKTCKSRNDFQKSYEGAYTAASRNGWLEELPKRRRVP